MSNIYLHLGIMMMWQMGKWVSDTEVSESQYCHYIMFTQTVHSSLLR